MKSPASILRYMSTDYKIRIGETEKDKQNIPYMGTVDWKIPEILLYDEMESVPQKLTLLHEIVHIMLRHSGIEDTEELVEGLACGMFELLNQNPWLPDYVTGK